MTEPASDHTLAAIRAARESGDFATLTEHIPYLRFMNMEMRIEGDDVVGSMLFEEQLIGNFSIRALHGGTLGAFLETVAAFQVIYSTDCMRLPRIVSITIEYLRSAEAQTTFARAQLTRQGRRIAVARAFAWQGDPERPVAAANAHFLLA